MALIKDGYFQDTYWASQYWQEDYWSEYGEVAETVQAAQYRPVTRVVRRKRLSPHVLTLIKQYLERKLNDADN